MVKVVIVFYSLYTHTYQVAEAIAEGCREVEGVEVSLWQVPETLSEEQLKKRNALQGRARFRNVPVMTKEHRGELEKADAIFFGTPTRYGMPSPQILTFFDDLAGLWFANKLVGKIGSAFGGSGSQHGGQETTLMALITGMMHLGMIVAGVPYSCNELRDRECTEASGGTPYGSTHIAGFTGARLVSAREREIARFQGRHVSQLAKRMSS